MPNVKRFGYKVELQFNNIFFVIDQNIYATKIVNACIAYDLDYWPGNTLNNFFGKILCNNDEGSLFCVFKWFFNVKKL